MDSLYYLRDWFYECDRLLFLAEVHFHKEDVVPTEHRFSHELTSSCLDKMFSTIRKMTKDGDYCISFDSCTCKDDVVFLKEILDNISSDKWDYVDLEHVLKAQEIVHKLANAVTIDILENSNLRRYPHIYNVCKSGDF